ncbi:MAG: hypothetical protein JWM09_814 [Francisellaceae bacterium]|nr:hypothetical protein [Francisellaceae bacterium]
MHTQIYSLKELIPLFESLSPNDLVVFDVDQVLIDPTDIILSYNGEALKSLLLKKLEREYGVDKANEFYSIIIKDRAVRLVEPETPKIIQQLIDKKIPVVALTAFPTGPFGVINNLEDWRLSQLKNLNIDFSNSFKNKIKEPHYFKELYFSKENKRNPLFKDGILFTGTGGMGAHNVGKGQVLQSFLTLVGSTGRVIFIDDNKNHLENVLTIATKNQIPLQAFQYLGAAKLPAELNESLSYFQFEYLTTHKKWLADAKALELIKKYPKNI